NMLLWAVDLFLDMPLDTENKRSVTFYAGYFNYDFGPGYIRNIGINNAANGQSQPSFSKFGNSFAAIGTGDIYYGQLGYRFDTPTLGQVKALMPYIAAQLADYERFGQLMLCYDYGIHFIFARHDSKMSLGVQDRPVFEYNPQNELMESDRKIMAVLQ